MWMLLRLSEEKPAVNGITARSPIHVLMKFLCRVVSCICFWERGPRGFSSPFHLVHRSGSSDFTQYIWIQIVNNQWQF